MIFCYPKYTHFALWGNKSLDVYRVYLQLSNYYEVDCFLSDEIDAKATYFSSIPSYNIDEYLQSKRNKSVKIIITLRHSEPWQEYVQILSSKGLHLFEDYNLFFLLNSDAIDLQSICTLVQDDNEAQSILKKFANGRQLFFINGNCQTTLLQQYMLSNKQFASKYCCVALPRICQWSNSVKRLYEIAIRCSSLVLSQPISDNNRFTPLLSSNNLKFCVEKNARFILIPKLTFAGYFPQLSTETNQHNIMLGNQPVFAYGDRYIDEMLQKGYSYEQIKHEVLADNFLAEDYIRTYFDEQLEKFQEDEALCDVKMYDYVKQYAKNIVLWHSFNHPTNMVIKELAKRILSLLGISNCDDAFIDLPALDGGEGLSAQMQLVYPSVYKGLGIPAENKLYYLNKNSSAIKVDNEDYIRIYCNQFKRETPIIDVWGSCVSRELFNFTTKFKLGAYLLQNPIHTMWKTASAIDENLIKGSSNFTKRMAMLEFKKNAINYFKERFNAPYLIVDTCDCRNDYWIVDGLLAEKTWICDSISAQLTLNSSEMKLKDISKGSVFDLPDEYWDECISKFVSLIKTKYEESHIIINRFCFAEQYMDSSDKLEPFDKIDYYRKVGDLTAKIEEKLIKLMPQAKVLSAIKKPIANSQHKIGCSPMHYIDECYYIQNVKLENLLGIISVDQSEIKAMETNLLQYLQ